VNRVQLEIGLAADFYPTAGLLARLRGGERRQSRERSDLFGGV
jgi:hypothetical protein